MKKMVKTITTVILATALVFAGCGQASNGKIIATISEDNSGNNLTDTSNKNTTGNSQSTLGDANTVNSGNENIGTPVEEIVVVPTKDAEDSKVEIVSDFEITVGKDGGNYTKSGNTYTITTAGDYTLSGNLSEGSIIVNAGDDDKVNLNLNGVVISSSSACPVYVINADSVKIKSEEGTYNEINDLRTESASNDENGKAAIWADCDLSLTGKGTLVVSASYNDGIHSKDDLSVKNVTLKVTAVDNALKGNDAVEIQSGNLVLISTGGDGIKTSNTELSAKGNQKGIITISGGNIDIYACCDAIDAAYDAIIETDGNLNIYTGKYSEYTGSKTVSGGADLYLVLPSNLYNKDYTYYGYFYNDDYSAGVWAEAVYETMISSGRTRYYGMLLKAPSNYVNVQYFEFKNDTTPNTDTFVAATEMSTFNSQMNGFLFRSVDSNNVISGDYTSISFGMGGQGGNSDKSTYSTKGIKAGNEVIINNGTINLTCADDGIHSDKNTLDTGKTGAGNVNINGGTISIASDDDGIHAENIVNINDGFINITKSYEGIEGNVINVNGGKTYAYASDDAVNACAGSSTPLVNITGGYLDVTTPSRDTDAIDSNGNITMSGGFVLVKGGNSQGSVAGSVDTDGKITITGGYMVALGGICELPTNSANCYASRGTSFTSGDYELKDKNGATILTFSLSKTYSSCWICSDKLETGVEYTLYKDGTSKILNWTQTAGNAGDSAGSFGGFGGGGGFGGKKGR